jgi:outer membrane protein OmpA-like peptidoglycan-associated protein
MICWEKIMKLKPATILILATLLAFSGCVLNKTSPKQLVCPLPVQDCKSVRWQGIAMDTSMAFRQVADSFFVFEKVKQINTVEDEWCLSFIDRKKAILTFNDENEQRIMKVRMINDNLARIESGMGYNLEGSIGIISSKGNDIVFAASYPFEDPDYFIGNSDIYTAELKDNMIVNIRNIGSNINKNRTSWESHPSYSPDKNVIFFSTDINPLKSTDLWFTIKKPDGSWSDPMNCGNNINTDCDEITPFITHDGAKLLFSSNGHESVGGYDIFESDISPAFWQAVKKLDYQSLKTGAFFSKPRNMRPPLNTEADELFPSSPGKIEDLLYYSSNQSSQKSQSIMGTGGFDIYVRRKTYSEKFLTRTDQKPKPDLSIKVEEKKDVKIKEPEYIPPTFKLQGTVYNADTKEVIPDANITVREIKQVDLLKERELEITSEGKDIFFDAFKTKSDVKGNYSVELEKDKDFEVTAEAGDLFFDSFKIRVDKDDTTSVIKKDFFIPAELTLRINFPTDVYNAPYKYALDSNGVETNQTWKEAIDLLAKNLLQTTEKVEKLILIGHTDDAGSDAYNLRLGQNRVNFIIEQLVRRGVPRERLEGQSAGESQLLERREGESLAAWRKRCRRVELQKVLKKD